jgi:hypothetical protein
MKDATRLLNFALDDYSYIAMTASGRWKFDDSTHVDADGNQTFPIATATLQANEKSLPLATEFLMLNQVQIEIDGEYQVLEPVDVRDSKHQVLRTTYSTSGKPQKYDYDARSVFLYPASDTDRTVKILYSRASPYFDIANTTATIGIPRIHHEYLPLKAALKLGMRLSDTDYTRIEREVAKWEGVDGQSGGKIRDYYSKRDQDTPRRLKGIINVPA